jgi:MFS family permease
MVADGIVPALPVLQRELNASTDSMGWFYTAPMLSAVIATPIIAKFTDVMDKRRVLMLVLAILSLGMLLSVLAESAPMLVAGQLLSGLCLSLVPISVGIIGEQCDGNQARVANSIVGGLGALTPCIGLLLCGPIVDNFSYRWLFGGPLAILIVCWLTSWRLAERPAQSINLAVPAIDWLGALWLSIALGSGLYAISRLSEVEFQSPLQLMLLSISFLASIVWWRHERASSDPLVDLNLLRNPAVVGIAACMFTAGFLIIGVSFCIPVWAQLPIQDGGLSATVAQTGNYFLVLAIAGTLVAPIASPLGKILGSRALMVMGIGCLSASTVLLVVFPFSESLVLVAMSLLGASFSLVLIESMNVALRQSPRGEATQTSALGWVAKSIGATLGGQIAASLMAISAENLNGPPTLTGIRLAMLVCAIVGGIGIGMAFLIPRRHHQIPV